MSCLNIWGLICLIFQCNGSITDTHLYAVEITNDAETVILECGRFGLKYIDKVRQIHVDYTYCKHVVNVAVVVV